MVHSLFASHRTGALLILLAVPFALAACATNGSAVRGIAAQELGCPSSSIRVSRVDTHIYRATGCGSSVEVACYDPYESTGASKGWADPLTAGDRSRCESLLRRPTVTSASLPAATRTPGSTAPQALPARSFDRELAAKLLGASATRARSCAKRNGPTGTGHARITFAPDGSITAVVIDAPFADTDVGRCVAEDMAHVSLPAFDGGPITVGKHFEIPGGAKDGSATPTEL